MISFISILYPVKKNMKDGYGSATSAPVAEPLLPRYS